MICCFHGINFKIEKRKYSMCNVCKEENVNPKLVIFDLNNVTLFWIRTEKVVIQYKNNQFEIVNGYSNSKEEIKQIEKYQEQFLNSLIFQ